VNKNRLVKGAIWVAGLLLPVFMAPLVGSQEAQPVSSFRPALPGYEYRFPRDFYSHDDFRIEWWYCTGHLEDAAGRSFGYQLTFFRVALDGKGKVDNPSQWKIDHIYFAHMTLSDIENEKFYFFERINRAGLGQAGAESDQLKIWNEDWSLTESDKAHHLKAREGEVAFDLKLTPSKPLVIHGRHGVSQKGEASGNASHYFTFTRMQTEGQVTLKGTTYRVKGLSWMDHEFSSNQLSDAQIGWDWFSVQLDNGTELMLYQIRKKNGAIEKNSSGTWVDADQRVFHSNRRTVGQPTVRRHIPCQLDSESPETRHPFKGDAGDGESGTAQPALDLHLLLGRQRERVGYCGGQTGNRQRLCRTGGLHPTPQTGITGIIYSSIKRLRHVTPPSAF
jgi:predicted secreted hydrolase